MERLVYLDIQIFKCKNLGIFFFLIFTFIKTSIIEKYIKYFNNHTLASSYYGGFLHWITGKCHKNMD